MRLRKLLTVLLTLAMVVSLLPATAYAANNTATTMRLEKTQGTVTVSNATGKVVSQTGNMKLYNGYQVKTGAKSYAWISLDDEKVIKLDANSLVEVQKSGKNLTMYLASGNMFFNAKKPLKSGENFSIKTSTMTTGIRGTSGCVSVISARVTEIDLLTGKLEIVTEHPTLGIKKTAVLLAGQSATSLIDWEAMAASGEMADIIIKALTPEDVCGSCAIEIAADPALLERIEKEAPQLLPTLIAALAETKLAADQLADEEKQKQIDSDAANQDFPEEVDPLFEEEAASGGGGGGGSSAPVKNVVTADEWSNEDPETLGLKEQLAAANAGEVDEIDLTGDVTIPAGEEFIVEEGSDVTLNLGESTLTLTEGSIENNGNMTITNTQGFIIGSNGAPVVINHENAILTMDDGLIDTNHNIGVQNYGTFTMTGGEITGADDGICVENYGTFIMEGGAITVNGIVGVDNYGTFTMTDGTVAVNGGRAISNKGTFTMNGGTILGQDENSQETGIYNYGGTVTLNTGAVLKDILYAVENYNDFEADVEGNVIIDGVTFDGIAGTMINNDGAVVTQYAATIRNTTAGQYINNYSGTVNLYGGDIHAEGVGAAVYNQMAELNIYGGEYTIYGSTGIFNGNMASTVNMTGGTIHVLDGIGIKCSSEGNLLNLTKGSIIAEDSAQCLLSSASDTTLTLGDTFEMKARSASRVSNIIPEGWSINFVDDYYMLTKGGSTDNISVVKTAADFIAAVMNCTEGGAVTLDADIILNQDVLDELGMVAGMNVTANSSKEMNIDLNGNTLALKIPLENTGKLRFTNSGEDNSGIEINDGGALKNSGTLAINEAHISGTAAKLIENSGTLTLNNGFFMKVEKGCDYGIYNTGELILNMGASADGIKVSAGVGIYSGGSDAMLTMKSGKISAENPATAIQFAGGEAALTGGSICWDVWDDTLDKSSYGCAIDATAGSPVFTKEIKTLISGDAELYTYKGEDIYRGELPEGYYMRYIAGMSDIFSLTAYQDTDDLIAAIYEFKGRPPQWYDYENYESVNYFDKYLDELKLAEDVTISMETRDDAIGNWIDKSMGVLCMKNVENMAGTLQIDLMGHTLTLDIPIEVYGNLEFIDSVGGGKIVTSLETPFILDGDYLQEDYPEVESKLTVDDSLIKKVQEEPVMMMAKPPVVEGPTDQPTEEPTSELEEELIKEDDTKTEEQEPIPAENDGDEEPVNTEGTGGENPV